MNEQHERERLVARGLQLADTLPDIMPDQATERLQAVYEDIQHTLRVPIVNKIFRTLANYPDYLIPLWQEVSPGFRTNGFEQAADNLREKSLLESLPENYENDWAHIEKLDKLRAFNDTIFYVLPKLLLVATAFYETSFGNWPSTGRRRATAPGATSPLTAGIAEGTAKVSLLKPAEASEKVQQLFESIKKAHGHPLVSSYFRGLGNWPQFLEEVWQQLQPQVGSPAYEQLREYLVEQALNGLRSLPIDPFEKPPLAAEQKEEIQALLAAFRFKFIPEMLLDATFIKALLDGPEEAFTSRFSVSVAEEDEQEE